MKIHKKEIRLSKANLAKVVEVMDKFPDVPDFILHERDCCEIGSTLHLEIPSVVVNGVDGAFTTEIEGVESW